VTKSCRKRQRGSLSRSSPRPALYQHRRRGPPVGSATRQTTHGFKFSTAAPLRSVHLGLLLSRQASGRGARRRPTLPLGGTEAWNDRLRSCARPSLYLRRHLEEFASGTARMRSPMGYSSTPAWTTVSRSRCRSASALRMLGVTRGASVRLISKPWRCFPRRMRRFQLRAIVGSPEEALIAPGAKSAA